MGRNFMRQDFFYFLVEMCFFAGYAFVSKNFCKKFLEISKRDEKIVFLLFFFSFCIGNLFCSYSSYILGISMFHFFLLGAMILLFQEKTEKKILMAAILITILELIGNFSSSCFSCLLLFLLQVVKIVSSWNFFLKDILSDFFQFIIVAGVIYFIAPRLKVVFQEKVKRWYLMLAFPLFFIVIVMDLLNWCATKGILLRGNEEWNLYYNQLLSHSAIIFLTLLFMCATYFYVFGMNRIYMEQKQKEQYQAQVMYYKMLEEQYGQMEHLRHDMKNHMISLQGLLENQKWEKVKSYLQKMMEIGALEADNEATGNIVVDALLYQKQKIATQKNILWECNMQVPKDSRIADIDFCVLIGNILDNALEACEKLLDKKEKFIILKSGVKKDFFLLEVKNGTDLEDRKVLQFMKKADFSKSGIGLSNIRETVEKYHGTLEIKLENHVFVICILLPLL